MSATTKGAWASPPPGTNGATPVSLADALSLGTWLDRQLAPPVMLMGDVITDNTRIWLVGTTGIGKTLLAHAIAGSIAAGQPFAGHWPCDRATRVLVIDGEMSVRGLQQRLQLMDGNQPGIADGMFMLFSMQDAEDICARFPQLPKPAQLNTQEGIDWMVELIKLLSPGLVVFDNVMSLLGGSMKEEDTWEPTKTLVQYISKLGIAQLWLDHTGWNSSRQYGSSTKGWMFDAVGVLRPMEEEQKAALGKGETGFVLSFDPPAGKHRNRTPDRWDDFSECQLVLGMQGWVRVADGSQVATKGPKLSPWAQKFHKALLDVLATHPTRPGECTREAWVEQCIALDYIEPAEPGDTAQERNQKQARFRKYLQELQGVGMVASVKVGSIYMARDLSQHYGP